ncbi:MAG: SDR family oxidoreductase [Bdellovibrionales bacterium]|nr:SDR family oxidoreductase [Bdellovibrionales bacterium]
MGSTILKKVILITGCSSGLGFALAQQLVGNKKYRLIITCRENSFKRISEAFTETEEVILRKLDVTLDLNINEIVDEVCKRWGRIDVLINNAGVCFRSVVEHMDFESEMIQLKTNYLGPMSLTRSILPIMREQKGGYIINISSVSGMVSMPTMASYSASKHALEGATESLWYETKPYGIKVTLVEPGFINSDSFKRVLFSKKAQLSHELRGPHSEYYYSMSPFIEKLMNFSFSKPTTIARKIIKILEKENPPLRLRVTFDAIIFGFLKKILPVNLFHKIMFSLLPGTKKWGFINLKSTHHREQRMIS